jgi:antitoxin component of MazEF toxin-antitoxin module
MPESNRVKSKIFKTENSFALKLPKALKAKEGTAVSIEAHGDTWVIRPVKTRKWPRGFFEKIRITDPAFRRPNQWHLLACLFFFAATFSRAADAQPTITGAEIINYGTYSTGESNVYDDPNSPTGKVGLGVTTPEKQTDNIPAKLNTCFGFYFVIHGKPADAPITMKEVVKHPPMVNAQTGESSTEYSEAIQLKLEDRQCAVQWVLSHDWEIVKGEWTFELFDGDHELLSQKFNVGGQ